METQGTYVIGNPALHDRPDLVQRILTRTYNRDAGVAAGFGPSVRDMPENASLRDYTEGANTMGESCYVLVITPREPFIWTGRVMNCGIKTLDFDTRERRVRLVADGPLGRLVRAKHRLYNLFPAFREVVASEAMAHIARVNREIKKIKTNQFRFVQNIVAACDRVQEVARAMDGSEGLLAAYYLFAAETSTRSLRPLETKYLARLVPTLMLFSIRWVNFICEDCQPSDGRTFKWAVQALEFVRATTGNNNILKLNLDDYAHLRSGVASCMALLISHFDVLGARSSSEAKKEKGKLDAARQEARRTLAAKLADMRAAGAVGGGVSSTFDVTQAASTARNSSLKIVSSRLADKVEVIDRTRKEIEADMRMVGRVLDTERPEDKGLLFLASSSSNISIRWQQGKFIGGGTFGQVYLGVNLDSGDLMAVKEIRCVRVVRVSYVGRPLRTASRIWPRRRRSSSRSATRCASWRCSGIRTSSSITASRSTATRSTSSRSVRRRRVLVRVRELTSHRLPGRQLGVAARARSHRGRSRPAALYAPAARRSRLPALGARHPPRHQARQCVPIARLRGLR
jgi:mitogen-activated protein kinase kinase kinase